MNADHLFIFDFFQQQDHHSEICDCDAYLDRMYFLLQVSEIGMYLVFCL